MRRIQTVALSLPHASRLHMRKQGVDPMNKTHLSLQLIVAAARVLIQKESCTISMTVN